MNMRCSKANLEQRCEQRGYTLQEVMACVVATNGDEWTVNVYHPSYPRHDKHIQALATTKTFGPGTELSKLLKRFGINPTPTCRCRAKAEQMNAWGPDECERPERIEEVLAVMREEAKVRGLPFLDAAGRLLVKRAIRNARKAAS